MDDSLFLTTLLAILMTLISKYLRDKYPHDNWLKFAYYGMTTVLIVLTAALIMQLIG